MRSGLLYTGSDRIREHPSNIALIHTAIPSGLVLFTLLTYQLLQPVQEPGQPLHEAHHRQPSAEQDRHYDGQLQGSVGGAPGLELSTEADIARIRRAIDSKPEINEQPECLLENPECRLEDCVARQSADPFNRLLNTKLPAASPAPP